MVDCCFLLWYYVCYFNISTRITFQYVTFYIFWFNVCVTDVMVISLIQLLLWWFNLYYCCCYWAWSVDCHVFVFGAGAGVIFTNKFGCWCCSCYWWYHCLLLLLMSLLFVVNTDTVVVDTNTFGIIYEFWCGFNYCWLVGWLLFSLWSDVCCFDNVNRIKLQYLIDVSCLVKFSVGGC